MKFKASTKKKRLGGAVYILPNLFTTGNLFFGFFSIIKCLQGDFMWASGAILLAAVFDMLDGSVARLTGGTSEFGVQYDSLCDLVSFGVAPAFVMYKGGLDALGRMGWIICFMYLACGALRLARFNVQSSIGKASGDFVGLPIPMAAAVIACFVSVWSGFDIRPDDFAFVHKAHEILNSSIFRVTFFCIAGVGLALAMVTNVPYRSHKTLKLKGVKPFKMLVLSVLLTGLVAYQPELFGFLLFAGYAVSGPLEWIFGRTKAVDDDDIFEPGSGSVMETAADERGYPSDVEKN